MTQNSGDFPVGVICMYWIIFCIFFVCVCVWRRVKRWVKRPHPPKQMCTAHRFLASTMDLVFAGQDMKGLIKIQNIALSFGSSFFSEVFFTVLQHESVCHCLVSLPREICHGAVWGFLCLLWVGRSWGVLCWGWGRIRERQARLQSLYDFLWWNSNSG